MATDTPYQQFTSSLSNITDTDSAAGIMQADAQNQAYSALGPNAIFSVGSTKFKQSDIAIPGTNPPSYYYTGTYTVSARAGESDPVEAVVPVTPEEQKIIDQPDTPAVKPTEDTVTPSLEDGIPPGGDNTVKEPTENTPAEIPELLPDSRIEVGPSNAPEVKITSKKITPLTNPLHDYDSYTYGLSLHLITEDQFNSVVENPEQTYIPQNVIVASAQKYNNAFKRNPYFTEDFYFEELKIGTIIGSTAKNRSTNLVECSFTIIEPNGFTFINRLIKAVYNAPGDGGVGGKNYLAHPYILQIDFYGYKNAAPFSGDAVYNPDSDTSWRPGSGPIPGLTKVLPIRLTAMKSRVTSRGTEYQIDAVPFNHQAYSQIHVVSPSNIQVKAKTVQDVFGSGAGSPEEVGAWNNYTQRENAASQEQTTVDEFGRVVSTDGRALSDWKSKQRSSSSAFQATGFADAINDYNQSLKDRNQLKYPNKVRVVFNDEIGKAEMFPTSGPLSVQQTAPGGNTTADQKSELRQAAGAATNQLDFNGTVMSVPAGTSIEKLIDWAVRNSKYIEDQEFDPTIARTPGAAFDPVKLSSQLKIPLRWFKIVPKIKIIPDAYDDVRKQYALDITYYVKPWTVNSNYLYAPQGKTPGAVKQYDWMYTGQNKDVLDMQIDFDMLYYIQVTAERQKSKATDTTTIGDTQWFYENDGTASTTNASGVNQPSIPQSKLQPMPVAFVGQNIQKQNRPGAQPQGGVTGGDIQQNLNLSSRGDMINLKLQIIGDPQFIKQDDIFSGQSEKNSLASRLTRNGSLIMDDGELYVFVNFQSPIDYDESTGLAIPGQGPYQYSEFSGDYKIIRVDSVFRKGKFEQTLELARLPLTDAMRKVSTHATQRIDNYVGQGLGQLTTLPNTRFSGPRISQIIPGAGTVAGAVGLLSAASQPGGIDKIVSSVGSTAMNYATKTITKEANQAISSAMGKVSDEIKGLFGGGSDNLPSSGDFASTDWSSIDGAAADSFDSLTEGLDFGDMGLDSLDVGDLGGLVEDANFADIGVEIFSFF